MTLKEEIIEFKNRWEVVNRREIEELRHTPIEYKFHQLAILMMSAEAFRLGESFNKSDEVREQWNRLRRLYNAI